MVSSPTGVMVSDQEQKIIGGDLTVETAKGTLQLTDGVIRVNPSGISVTGKGGATIQLNQGNSTVTLRAKGIDIMMDAGAKAKEPEAALDHAPLPADPPAAP